MNKHELQTELLRLELSKLDYFLDSTYRNRAIEEDSPIPLEDRLSKLWNASFTAVFLRHLNDLQENGMLKVAFALAYESLRTQDLNIPPEEITQRIENTLSETVSLLDRPFGIDWALEHENDIDSIVNEMYGLGQEAAIRDMELETSLEQDDRDSALIAQLVAAGVIYSSVSSRSQIILPIATRLTREGLLSNTDTTAMTNIFASGLRELIPLKSDIYYQNLSSIILNRTRNYGRVLAYSSLGATYIQINGIPDRRQCARCASIDGMVFRVDDVVSNIERFTQASTLEDVIESAPFINSIDAETNEYVLANGNRVSVASESEVLAQAGIMLPIHGGCRCSYEMWRG